MLLCHNSWFPIGWEGKGNSFSEPTYAEKWDPVRGFREPGEWGPKQPAAGSQEQDAKITEEQGAEEINLGSMEHRVCHKIMVFYTIENFRLASLGILTQIVHFGTDFNSGSKFTFVEGAGRYQNGFREHAKLFWGAPIKKIQGAGRQGSNFKGSQEPGTPPYGVSKVEKPQW